MMDMDCPTPVVAYCGIKYIPGYTVLTVPEITDIIVANIEDFGGSLWCWLKGFDF